jgi:ethanolamine utilization protein EutJ
LVRKQIGVREMDLEKANALIQQYEAAFSHGVGIPPGETLYTGVDLGTSYIVLSVVDGSGKPVGGAKCFAKVVKDGLVVH